MKVKRRFGVATGQASYPTPLGSFEIVRMQRNPWWIPPDSDWAKNEKPVPPGPGNPLGTRWMGLDSPGVGIHGTPDAASIGYSASHGCIRMLVPEAEWLFERVELDTPVYILDA
jgi:lipoprotein-anchoring transpeptidase ErfK/SrfK